MPLFLRERGRRLRIEVAVRFDAIVRVSWLGKFAQKPAKEHSWQDST
jgi:hypothetical protein